MIEQALNQIFGSKSTIHLLRSKVDETYLVSLSANNVQLAKCAGIPQVFKVTQYDEMLRRASTIGYGLETVG